MKTCSVKGCDRPAVARGWCRRHYRAWNERGLDPHTWVPKRERHKVVDGQKQCFSCKEWKPLDEFSPSQRNSSGRATYCRPCQSKVAQRSVRRRSPEQIEHYRAKRRARTLAAGYGLTVEEFDRLFAAQGGKCICGATEPGGKHRRFHVDHDHATGRVRGILCHGCNTALGLVGESPDRLEMLARYLRG